MAFQTTRAFFGMTWVQLLTICSEATSPGGFPPAFEYSCGSGWWLYCRGNSKYSVFSLPGFDHLPSIPWGEAVLFEEPQVCGQAQVVSAGTCLICGLLLCSELEEMMGYFSDLSYSLNKRSSTQMKTRVHWLIYIQQILGWRKRQVCR